MEFCLIGKEKAMFNMNNRSKNLASHEKARKEFNKIEFIASSPLSLSVLLGTVSIIAFLSVQHSALAATTKPQDIEQRMFLSHRNPSGGGGFHEVQSSLEMMPGHDDLNHAAIGMYAPPNSPLEGSVPSKKSIDFSEWVQIQMSEVKDAPPPTAVLSQRSKASYILPVISSTVVKPIGRVLLSTAKGTYYAIPHVGAGSWWTVRKTVEALGATVSATNDAATYVVEAAHAVQA